MRLKERSFSAPFQYNKPMPHLVWKSKSFNEPAGTELRTDSLVYPNGAGYPDVKPENRLVLGDNLAVMASLLETHEDRINLIYVDPPFFTNRSYPARVGRGEDSRRPEEWELAEGYADHWPDLEAYLDMLYPRLILMHRLLSPTGTLYLHLDWHADAYARVLLDEIFGPERLLNEIVWTYHGPSPIRSAFNRKHDIILAYTKSGEYTFNVDDVREPYNPNTVKTFESSPKAGFGKVPDLKRGKVPEDWWYFPVVARLHNERTGYPTQKPESLLERIILASSNPGDLVADFFCGSGTTLSVAAQNGRRFLGVDATWRAVSTARTRLVRQEVPAFSLEHSAELNLQAGPRLPWGVHWTDGNRVRLDFRAAQEVDYWEIDPAWDGETFRSAVQAVRPLRKEQIATELPLPGGACGPVCVRLVLADGRHLQTVVQA